MKMRIGFVTADQHESLVSLLCEINRHYHPDCAADRAVVAQTTADCQILWADANSHRTLAYKTATFVAKGYVA